jgi:Ricin-type beta-trefoil lectin domain-like
VISEPHANGVGIHGWEGFGNKNSVWEFVVDKNDSKPVVGIRNVASKFLLNIWAGINTDMAAVKLHEVAEHVNSKWILHYIKPNVVNIEGLGPRRYLSIDTNATHNGCNIAMWG